MKTQDLAYCPNLGEALKAADVTKDSVSDHYQAEAGPTPLKGPYATVRRPAFESRSSTERP